MDSKLSVPYNSIGLDPSNGLSVEHHPGLPDSQLINPVYFAIAGIFVLPSGSLGPTPGIGDSLAADPEIYTGLDYQGFVLSCSYQTWDVDYTSYDQRPQDFNISPTKNGSVAEIYHGYLQPFSLGGADSQLQDMLQQAIRTNTSQQFADVWADLYSQQILSVIGAFTSPRANLEEQTRTRVVVTKLFIPAVVMFLAVNFAYVPLGIWLYYVAYKKSLECDIRDLYELLSTPGVIISGFSDQMTLVTSRGGSQSCGFKESRIVSETTHIRAVLDAGEGYRFTIQV